MDEVWVIYEVGGDPIRAYDNETRADYDMDLLDKDSGNAYKKVSLPIYRLRDTD